MNSASYVLGCCLLDEGFSLDLALQSELSPSDFEVPSHRSIFGHLREMRLARIPIGLDTLVPRLNGEANVAELMELADPLRLGSTAHFGHHLRTLLDDSARRRLLRAAAELTARGNDGASLPDLIAEAERLVNPVLTNQQAPQRARQLLALGSLRVSHQSKPAEPSTRLFLAGKPVATPGNIVTLISRAKTGKTATLGACTAAIIAATTSTLDRDTFKFKATNPHGHAVIILDTEQSPYDAYVCYQRALDRAGAGRDPAWLHHYSLVGYSPAQLHLSLDLLLTECAKAHGGIFCIILDGCADFVNSVNDEAEANGFVTWLRARTVTHQCPAICVIHSNEAEKSGDDGRGHLGKQLIRKAESNLLLKKDGEVTIITSDKQRKAPITEADGVAFRWDDDRQMHVSCEGGGAKPKGGRGRNHTIHEFIECIPAKGEPMLPGTVIHRKAVTVAEIKVNTFKDLLAQAYRDGDIDRRFDEKLGYLYGRMV